MSIQFISRAKADLIGELVEAPVYQQTASGAVFAKIKIQTVEHFISKGERKMRKEIHDVTVFNKLGVDLLKSFGKPGVHFLVTGKIVNKVIEVSQYGGEIFVMTTGVDGDAPSSRASQPSGEAKSAEAAKPAGSSGARPSGGLGRIGNSRPGPSQPPKDDDDEVRSSPSRSDSDLDDDIPF